MRHYPTLRLQAGLSDGALQRNHDRARSLGVHVDIDSAPDLVSVFLTGEEGALRVMVMEPGAGIVAIGLLLLSWKPRSDA